MRGLYEEDLAYVHHAGFGGFARDAAQGLLGLLRGAGIHGGRVVDLGCGSGILARELLGAGYEVLGVDSSPGMLAIARGVAPGARLLVASLHEVELPPCAAVTAIGEGLGYLPPEGPPPALPELFTRIFRALAPGGLLVFDVVLRSPRRPMRYRAAREGPDWRVETEVDERPEESLLTRGIRVVRWIDGTERRSEETHRVRTFSRAELEDLLRETGFTVRAHRAYGAAALPPRRLAFRARKPARA